jgi:hypothetical protein
LMAAHRSFGRNVWTTVGAQYHSHSAGRVWFEVEVLEAKGKVVVGFSGTNFRGSMVGYQDTESWSIYSELGGTFHGRYAPLPDFPLYTPLLSSSLSSASATYHGDNPAQ